MLYQDEFLAYEQVKEPKHQRLKRNYIEDENSI